MPDPNEKNAVEVKYPTGYTSSALPFYSHLDDQKFEQFCTDLLNLHPLVTLLKDGKAVQHRIVEATRLLGGNDQKGADIRAKDDQGAIWFFQCKHTKSFVESQVDKALELAETALPQGDQFVLATTCGLNENAQAKIHGRPKWRWWDASRLTTEISILRPREDAINLVHRFFGPDWVKRLFTCSDQPLLKWQEFFARDLVEKDKHFRHTIPFVPWSDALAKLKSFAQSGAGHALILSAAGGQGKSRLLLELTQNIEEQPQAPRVRFLNLNRHGLSAEQGDFLAREEGDLLLIVDDAHRMDAAIQDMAQAAAKVKSIRLLIATRPQAVDAIKSQLYQNGYAEKLEEPLRLPHWDREDIRNLAQNVLDPKYSSQANALVALADRCPLLVVLGADLINSGEHLAMLPDKQAFRERVFKSFKNDFLHTQSEARHERLKRLISFLSFVSPARKNDVLLNTAAEILGCSPLDIDEDLGALEAAGLTVENWEGIRLYPDLFSDAVLMDACLDPRNRPSHLYKTILDKLALNNFPALIRNIAQADWEARSRQGTPNSLFDPIWRQFVARFEKGIWVRDERDIIDQYLKRIESLDADRSTLLAEWAPVAVFLPEKTLELTELAMKKSTSAIDRASACRDLPQVLKPIVVSHPKHAVQALNLLWSLAVFNTDGTKADVSGAITAIADAAAFAFQKPIEVSEGVLSWLEMKIQESSTIEIFRSRPWILSALLKPFFVREVQASLYAGKNTVEILTFHLRSEKVRFFRRRALTIVEEFLKSPDTLLACALVPVLGEAIKPAEGAAQADREFWRQDCLDVFKLIANAVKARQDSPTLLLLLRGVLRNRRQLNQDPVVRDERDRVLKTIPDTLELRVARSLTSYAHVEFPATPGPNAFSDRIEGEAKWVDFTSKVAIELSERFKTAHETCNFLRRTVDELSATNEITHPGELLQQLAQISADWCAAVLKELVEAKQSTLDRGLWAVLASAVTKAPEAYQEAIEYLPTRGRSTQLSELIRFTGFKQVNGGGLMLPEREAVLQAVKRKEESVVCELAWLCGFPLKNDPKWAMDMLSQLKPGGERSMNAIMEALGLIVNDHASDVEPQKVAECLGNVGECCFPESSPNEFGLTIVAQHFPKEVYEHVQRIFERAESNATQLLWPRVSEIPSLGPLGDAEYTDREIHALWDQALKSENGGFSREFRLALIRSLIWSDAARALDRTRTFVNNCKDANQIKLLAELVGPRPSRFVFDHPDIVRSILARAHELAVSDAVTKTLILAACGGGRTYTDTELDPEYKYILEQGDALANRFRDDPLLQPFYSEIGNWERHDLEWHRQRGKRE